MRTVHVIITGIVQGVGYRAWVDQAAGVLGLNGWVRNRFDGSVEAVFSGEDGEVDEMLAACRQGPRAAVVDAVRVTERPGERPTVFKVLPTM